MRRTLALALFVLAAGGLVLLVGPREVKPPAAIVGRRTAAARARGRDPERSRSRSTGGASRRRAPATAGRSPVAPAAAPLAAALDDLAGALASLQALDRFRSDDRAQFGLVSPRGRIRIGLTRGRRELLLGGTTPNGAALYARRARDPHLIVQIGLGILSAIDRVFFFTDAYRPEMG